MLRFPARRAKSGQNGFPGSSGARGLERLRAEATNFTQSITRESRVELEEGLSRVFGQVPRSASSNSVNSVGNLPCNIPSSEFLSSEDLTPLQFRDSRRWCLSSFPIHHRGAVIYTHERFCIHRPPLSFAFRTPSSRLLAGAPKGRSSDESSESPQHRSKVFYLDSGLHGFQCPSPEIAVSRTNCDAGPLSNRPRISLASEAEFQSQLPYSKDQGGTFADVLWDANGKCVHTRIGFVASTPIVKRRVPLSRWGRAGQLCSILSSLLGGRGSIFEHISRLDTRALKPMGYM